MSGLCLEHRFPKARTDSMDVLESCFFLLVTKNFLQVRYGHTVIDVVGTEGVTQGMHPGFSHSCLGVILFNEFPDTTRIQRRTVSGKKERLLIKDIVLPFPILYIVAGAKFASAAIFGI